MSFLSALENCPCLKGLPADLAAALAGAAVKKSCLGGEILFSQGAREKGLFLLTEGRGKLYLTTDDGRETIIGFIDAPGGVVGPDDLIGDHGRLYGFQAVSRLTACYVPGEDLARLSAVHAELTRRLMAAQFGVTARLVSFLEARPLDVASRVAAFLIARTNGDGRVKLDMMKKELAALFMTSPETVSRSFSRLKRAGLIDECGPDVIILNHQGLAELARGNRAAARDAL